MPLHKTAPKPAPSRETVQVRVSSAERLRYELRARELDLTLSDWLRLLARHDTATAAESARERALQAIAAGAPDAAAVARAALGAGLWMPGGEPLKGDERAPCPGCAHNGDEGCELVEQCQMREPPWGKYRAKDE